MINFKKKDITLFIVCLFTLALAVFVYMDRDALLDSCNAHWLSELERLAPQITPGFVGPNTGPIGGGFMVPNFSINISDLN